MGLIVAIKWLKIYVCVKLFEMKIWLVVDICYFDVQKVCFNFLVSEILYSTNYICMHSIGINNECQKLMYHPSILNA